MTLTRKTPLARTAMRIARPTGVLAQASHQKTRAKKCAICREPFTPARPGAKACSPKCAEAFAVAARAKSERAAAKAVRAADKVRKESLKGLREWIADAQVAFNAFIRERDRLAGHPCISSGKPLDWSGNNVDAGHYRSRGSAPHLRYDERNCHAQSKQENRWASGNATDFRIGLIARIGLAEVEALEAENDLRKFTISELKAIKATYVAKLKALRKGRPPEQNLNVEIITDWSESDDFPELDELN